MTGAVFVVALLMVSSGLEQARARGIPDGFADLTGRLLPAVVNVSSTQVEKNRRLEMPQLPSGDSFEEFFNHHGGGGWQDNTPVQQQATSLGSGFIIDPEGYVVTNDHLIQDAEEITVILHDDTVLEAELIGRDPKVDVALLKVSAGRNLPYVSFGDSNASRVGDWVMAIGNPFGLGGTVTVGIISAKTRDIKTGPYDSFIQTDAAINRGNSGGPLFNMDGKVIGINTVIFSPGGGSVGIGFAMPANLARPVLSDLRRYGRARRACLGVRIQTVTDEVAESLGMDQANGALVAAVIPDGPANKADIEAGDVVLEFNGHKIKKMRRLPAIVIETGINSRVPVVVWRDGERKTLYVTVGELDEGQQEAAVSPSKTQGLKDDGGTAISTLGLSVAPLTDGLRGQFGVPGDARGVVVLGIDSDGPAAAQNIQPGDVITQVGHHGVKNGQDILDQVRKAKDAGHETILLLIENATSMSFVTIPIKDR